MDARTRNLVRQRAGERCEYCHIPDRGSELPFHVEHIVASVHQRNDDPSNLAWACPRCNLHKGTNLTTIDPFTGERADVFNPRTDVWEELS
jgi:5-methylcytosine-specific restriction endonuclease McrA